MTFSRYVRLVGPDFIERARSHRASLHACQEAYRAFAESVGATSIGGAFQGARASVFFFEPRTVPRGWRMVRRPSASRSAGYTPKRGSETEAKLLELPPLPRADEVFPGYPIDIAWRRPNGDSGVTMIAFAVEPFSLGWTGGDNPVFFARVPDVEAKLKTVLDDYPGAVIERPESFSWPEGLERLTEAEYRLIIAQAEVEDERRRAAENKTAA